VVSSIVALNDTIIYNMKLLISVALATGHERNRRNLVEKTADALSSTTGNFLLV
jgi:hypothetical protein